jgi:hypothetical protein
VVFANATKTSVFLAGFYPALRMWGNSGMAGLLLVTSLLGLFLQMIFITRLLKVRWKHLMASQQIGLLAAAPFVIAHLLMIRFEIPYLDQFAVAVLALICCAAIMFALRNRLMSIATGRI